MTHQPPPDGIGPTTPSADFDFRAAYESGMTGVEIAEISGLTTNTVYARIRRAGGTIRPKGTTAKQKPANSESASRTDDTTMTETPPVLAGVSHQPEAVMTDLAFAEPNADSPPDPLLTPSEVSQLFRVDRGTVAKWTRDGRLPSIRTPGGRRRIPLSAVAPFLPAESYTQL